MDPLDYIHDIPFYQLKKYKSEHALCDQEERGWLEMSTEEVCDQISRLSFGLSRSCHGKNIGIFADHGSPYWNIVDFAIMKSQNISVPIHGNVSEEDLSHILADAGLDIVFVGGQSQIDQLPNDIKIYTLERMPGHQHYSSLFSEPMDTVSKPSHPDDLATIVYSSGSTGLPKGVMLSHRNIISNIKAVISLVPIHHKHIVASYLPLSHIFERVAVFLYMTVGASVYYIRDPKNLMSSVQEIKPHFMTSVPRILEKVYENIRKNIKAASPLKKRIARWALTSSKNARKQSVNPLRKIELILCDFLVFRKWRKLLGGRLEGIIVGAAAMPKHISQLFYDAGINIREGYGLTETSPIVSFNRFEAGGNQFGTVGIPIPGVQVKIHQPDEHGEGEILVRGSNVMLGYYHNKALTEEKIDDNGFFRTGDIGMFVAKRFLKITDRKKNIFKTSSGQYVAPQVLEHRIRIEELIDQTMVIGFARPFISALIIPNFVALEKWCAENNVHWTAPQYMVIHPKVHKLYQSIIDEINEELKHHEKIRSFHLLHEEWSVGSGEYTPTLKLKRNTILEKYAKEVEQLYN